MNQRERDLLVTNRLNLTRGITLSPLFYAHLRRRDILTEETESEMKSKETSKNQIGYLLDLLPRRGPQAYKFFIEALQETNQNDIVLIFEPDPEPRFTNKHEIVKLIEENKVQPVDQEYLRKRARYPPMEYQDNEEIYKRSEKFKKRVIIINIYFHNEVNDIKPRCGSDKDLDNLLKLFGLMDYDIDCQKELTSDGIRTYLKKEQKRLNDENDMYNVWMLIIMSHGNMGGYLGADGNRISFKETRDYFDGLQCPGLDGIPKVFIFQCCLGIKKASTSRLVTIDCDASNFSTDQHDAHSSKSTSHEKRDVFEVQSTVEDYVSFRHAENGSVFISVLVYIISRSCRHKDLNSMILIVSDVLSHFPLVNPEVEQSPIIHTTAKKKKVPTATLR